MRRNRALRPLAGAQYLQHKAAVGAGLPSSSAGDQHRRGRQLWQHAAAAVLHDRRRSSSTTSLSSDEDDKDEEEGGGNHGHSRHRGRRRRRAKPLFRGERKVVPVAASTDDSDSDYPVDDALPGRRLSAASDVQVEEVGHTPSASRPQAALQAVAFVAKLAAAVRRNQAAAAVGAVTPGDTTTQAPTDASPTPLAGRKKPRSFAHSDRRIPELDSLNAEDHEFVLCRAVVAAVQCIVLLVFLVVLTVQMDDLEAPMRRETCRDDDGDDVDCSTVGGRLSMCEDRGGGDIRVSITPAFPRAILLACPAITFVALFLLVAGLPLAAALHKRHRITERQRNAVFKIGSMVVLAVTVVLWVSSAVLYGEFVDSAQPTDFLTAVTSPSRADHPWNQQPRIPTVLAAYPSPSDTDTSDAALDDGCTRNAWALHLDFPFNASLQGAERVAADACWVDLSTHAYRSDSSIRRCTVASAPDPRRLWCCVQTLPFGDLGVAIEVRIIDLQRATLAYLIVSALFELASAVLTAALICLDLKL